MRQVLFITALAVLSWGNLAILGNWIGVSLPLFHLWLEWVIHAGGPPVAAYLAIRAWHQARRWRRMEEFRTIPGQGPGTPLARGDHAVEFQRRGPGSLERWSLWLLGIACLATLVWFPGSLLPMIFAWIW